MGYPPNLNPSSKEICKETNLENHTIALILGRKGSTGLPGKNTMSILGRPACCYPMLAAHNSQFVNRTWVSTDDENIAACAINFGMDVIDRPAELCTADSLFEDGLVHAMAEVRKQISEDPKYVVILMCNAICIDSTLVDAGIEALESNNVADSAVTVSVMNMYSPLRARRLDDEGYLKPFVPFESIGDPANLNSERDSQGDVYYADMSHSVVRTEWLDKMEEGLLPQLWMGQNIVPIPNIYGCDLDFPWQISTTEWWLREKGFTEETTPYDL